MERPWRAEKAEIKSAQMFCEIILGQLLGPNPGEGARTDLDANRAHTHGFLPRERVKDFRRYFGWQEAHVPGHLSKLAGTLQPLLGNAKLGNSRGIGNRRGHNSPTCFPSSRSRACNLSPRSRCRFSFLAELGFGLDPYCTGALTYFLDPLEFYLHRFASANNVRRDVQPKRQPRLPDQAVPELSVRPTLNSIVVPAPGFRPRGGEPASHRRQPGISECRNDNGCQGLPNFPQMRIFWKARDELFLHQYSRKPRTRGR
jgi:hypothetical protein